MWLQTKMDNIATFVRKGLANFHFIYSFNCRRSLSMHIFSLQLLYYLSRALTTKCWDTIGLERVDPTVHPLMLPFISIMPLEKKNLQPATFTSPSYFSNIFCLSFITLSNTFEGTKVMHFDEMGCEFHTVKSCSFLKAFTVCRHWWTVRLQCHPDSCIWLEGWGCWSTLQVMASALPRCPYLTCRGIWKERRQKVWFASIMQSFCFSKLILNVWQIRFVCSCLQLP